MHSSQITFNCAKWLILLALIVGLSQCKAEPESISRQIRPKTFTNAEDFKNFLDNMKDHYYLAGKARYGKRMDTMNPNDNFLNYLYNVYHQNVHLSPEEVYDKHRSKNLLYPMYELDGQ